MIRTVVNLQLEKLDATREELLSQLETVEESILHFRPETEKWSIVQILFHLNSSESISTKYMAKKSQGGASVPKTTALSHLRIFALKTALRNFTWKKPAVLPDPPEQLHLQEVLQTWNETRHHLKTLLEQLPDDVLNRNIFRHPSAGRMNASHALTFMQEHFYHHLPQIENRIAASRKVS